MNFRLICTTALLGAVVLQGCKTGYNRTKRPSDNSQTPPTCATSVINPNNASDTTEAVFNTLASLTCYSGIANGNLMGQALGDGPLASDETSIGSYAVLVDGYYDQHEETPAVISLEYGGIDDFSDDDIENMDDIVKQHWKKGGLVSISWKPNNPWLSGDDASKEYSSDVNLEDLLDNTSAVYSTWQSELDHIAEVLTRLQNAGVVVLWRPLPEMNDNTYWWGTKAFGDLDDETSAELYTNLWESIYDYLCDVDDDTDLRINIDDLNNLLWVYSPVDSGSTLDSNAVSSDWAYPNNYVDVIAPVVRADTLQFLDYETLVDLNRPLALAEWGPTENASTALNGNFDATLYSDRLKQSYPFVSYWVAPPDIATDTGDSLRALVSLDNLEAFGERGNIISLEEAIDYDMLETRTLLNETLGE